MSVYGDLLAAFPELIKTYQFFTMAPNVRNSGYAEKRNVLKRKGVFIRSEKSAMNIFKDIRVTNEAGIFYCFEFLPQDRIKQGLFFEDEDQIFLIKDDQSFRVEAGYSAYTCQLVQGNTDRQVENAKIEDRVVLDFPI